MNTFFRTAVTRILGLAIGLAASGAAAAAPSMAEHFESCREEAQVLYGAVDAPARVRLDDMRRGGRELRLRITTPDGESFNAVCEVNRRTGELLSLTPPRSADGEVLATVAGGH